MILNETKITGTSVMLQNQSPDNMVMSDPSGYQQSLYLSGPPEHSMGMSVSTSYSSPQQPTYTMASPSQASSQLLLMQQQQQQQQHMMLSQGPAGLGQYGCAAQGGSPPTGQEGTTTSEDSDDSTPHSAMMVGMKRPSPEPTDNGLAKIQKKPKVQKKKKKRDPNEPQKPVSAYALFFRDTQAAIKGQNPNASFGEVSKIVASMWDALDAEHKNVYKKKTEAAKKEYLKALAAYRASLVSKGAGESEGIYGGYGGYGGGYSGYSPPAALPSPPMSAPVPQQTQQQQQMANMAKKSPLLNSMMNERGNGQPPQGMMGPVGGHMGQPHLQQQVNQGGYMQQMSPRQHGEQHLVASPPPPPSAGPPASSAPVQQQPPQQPPRGGNTCIRHGCNNAAISNSEWEDEYCSNECVVSHCRDVFSSWVASNQSQAQNFSTVK
ncbi:TOX high mobility group box family member 4-like isoform X3 [Bacillus rossius redtenbacheri]|uniref:TOX high mobility group box family member 4-like isoform X3 n=1 Tax=Bacillus rossius redtenbacheri TaxID=93214 RepID=UPI002FDC827A